MSLGFSRSGVTKAPFFSTVAFVFATVQSAVTMDLMKITRDSPDLLVFHSSEVFARVLSALVLSFGVLLCVGVVWVLINEMPIANGVGNVACFGTGGLLIAGVWVFSSVGEIRASTSWPLERSGRFSGCFFWPPLASLG
jgi:hypothetical protein